MATKTPTKIINDINIRTKDMLVLLSINPKNPVPMGAATVNSEVTVVNIAILPFSGTISSSQASIELSTNAMSTPKPETSIIEISQFEVKDRPNSITDQPRKPNTTIGLIRHVLATIPNSNEPKIIPPVNPPSMDP